MFASHPSITLCGHILVILNQVIQGVREHREGTTAENRGKPMQIFQVTPYKCFTNFFWFWQIKTWSCCGETVHSISSHYFPVFSLQQNSIQQLTNQWRNRVNELKNPNTSTKIVSVSIREFSGKYLLLFLQRISLWIWKAKLKISVENYDNTHSQEPCHHLESTSWNCFLSVPQSKKHR